MRTSFSKWYFVVLIKLSHFYQHNLGCNNICILSQIPCVYVVFYIPDNNIWFMWKAKVIQSMSNLLLIMSGFLLPISFWTLASTLAVKLKFFCRVLYKLLHTLYIYKYWNLLWNMLCLVHYLMVHRDYTDTEIAHRKEK